MLFNDLMQRGLIKQVTNVEGVSNVMNTHGAPFYIGFDPTADSLHVGHLLQIVTAKRLKDAGMFPILLVGGATAQIGDPTGKSEMRKMLSQDDLDVNIFKLRRQLISLMPGLISVQDNALWASKLNLLSFIKDIGAHFSVNNMLRADCFKSRMENGGLSFLEFNYMLLQAFDFFHLFEKQNCALQIGGDDQWSNILAGIDLIHKKTGKTAFGLTLPLLTNSDGHKMGKTEKGTVWLDNSKTSVFDFFQFWRNLPDGDVIKCFKQLTFMTVSEIESLPFSSAVDINSAKKKLAFEITKFVHGSDAATLTLKQAEALFENNDASLIATTAIDDNHPALDLIIKCGFAKSRTDARNLINGRGISINDEVLTDPTINVTKIKFGNNVVVKKGKKKIFRFTIKDTNA
jgi:tyrosyl-tRNA synthetase